MIYFQFFYALFLVSSIGLLCWLHGRNPKRFKKGLAMLAIRWRSYTVGRTIPWSAKPKKTISLIIVLGTLLIIFLFSWAGQEFVNFLTVLFLTGIIVVLAMAAWLGDK